MDVSNEIVERPMEDKALELSEDVNNGYKRQGES